MMLKCLSETVKVTNVVGMKEELSELKQNYST